MNYSAAIHEESVTIQTRRSQVKNDLYVDNVGKTICCKKKKEKQQT